MKRVFYVLGSIAAALFLMAQTASTVRGLIIDQGGQVYNVRAYGVDCSGNPGAAAANTSAVVSLAQDYRTLLWPQGCVTYLNQVEITDKTHITFDGSNRGATLVWNGADNASMFRLRHVSYPRFTGFRMNSQAGKRIGRFIDQDCFNPACTGGHMNINTQLRAENLFISTGQEAASATADDSINQGGNPQFIAIASCLVGQSNCENNVVSHVDIYSRGQFAAPVRGVSVASGSSQLTCPACQFSSSDIGSTVRVSYVPTASGESGLIETRIAGVIDATHANLAVNATVSRNGTATAHFKFNRGGIGIQMGPSANTISEEVKWINCVGLDVCVNLPGGGGHDISHVGGYSNWNDVSVGGAIPNRISFLETEGSALGIRTGPDSRVLITDWRMENSHQYANGFLQMGGQDSEITVINSAQTFRVNDTVLFGADPAKTNNFSLHSVRNHYLPSNGCPCTTERLGWTRLASAFPGVQVISEFDFGLQDAPFGTTHTYGVPTPKSGSMVVPGMRFIGDNPGAPPLPASGFVMFIDTTDGGKLKIKGPSGTVTVIGNP
jgi:hypothetical protein